MIIRNFCDAAMVSSAGKAEQCMVVGVVASRVVMAAKEASFWLSCRGLECCPEEPTRWRGHKQTR